MSKSIMQNAKECYVTGSPQGLHKHHIFEGTANRRLSEKYGMWVWLRTDWHNMSDYGVHFDKALDIRLKIEGQRKFEKRYAHDKFMEVFGKNYL